MLVILVNVTKFILIFTTHENEIQTTTNKSKQDLNIVQRETKKKKMNRQPPVYTKHLALGCRLKLP